MISITITDLGALPQSERERLADYLRGPSSSKPAEVTTVTHVAPLVAVASVVEPVASPIVDTAAVFAPAAAVTPEKDASGVVWDARIHSSSRNMNKDGTWKRMRGCDDALFTQVMGELTGQAVAAFVPPVEAVVPPPPPPAPTGAPTTFPELMQRITAAGIAAPAVIAAVKETGESVGWQGATLPMLGTARAELIPELARRLGLV